MSIPRKRSMDKAGFESFNLQRSGSLREVNDMNSSNRFREYFSERITITKESTLSLMCDLAQQVYWFDVNTFKILRANFSDT